MPLRRRAQCAGLDFGTRPPPQGHHHKTSRQAATESSSTLLWLHLIYSTCHQALASSKMHLGFNPSSLYLIAAIKAQALTLHLEIYTQPLLPKTSLF